MSAAPALERPITTQTIPGSLPRTRALYALWMAALLALFALHFVHILADFPNDSPWMDYSKYTDEGWYASAAVRYHLTGHWFLPGDFNPAVALPVWPALLAFTFHFTGVSLAAARSLNLAILGLNLLLACLLVRSQAPRWTALLAVTLLVANPFLYAFSRLALLEPLLIAFLLLSWLAALRLPRSRRQPLLLAAIGVLCCLAVLTKTTAIFVLPSTVWLIAHACRFRLRASLQSLSITAIAALLPWSLWYFLFVRPHYPVDYQYFFSANQWPRPSSAFGWLQAFWYAFHGGLWIGAALCALVPLLLCLLLLPRPSGPVSVSVSGAVSGAVSAKAAFWRNPLVAASLLAIAGYLFFIGWHNNPQPRYYLIVLPPLVFLAALGTAALLHCSQPLLVRGLGALAVATLASICCAGTARIADYLAHPDYSWLHAVNGVTRYIETHPAPNQILLSISGADLSLMTRLPTLCDDYGTWDLPDRIRRYHPAWYAAWNEIDPGTLLDLQTQDSIQPVAQFPAFDDPDRNLLILYRLRPLPARQQHHTPPS